MAEHEDRLIEFGAAAADGAVPDVSHDTDAGLRSFLDELKTIAAIARAHSLSASLGDGSGSASALPAGTSWGSLVVRGLMGRGRFGDVYRAFDPTLQREVALKILRGRSACQDGVVNEGRLAARVRHPNVVTIYGAQTIDGRSGLWMELIDGHTLDAELHRRGRLPGDEVAAIGRQLCLALTAVHDAGLVHRDVKASNVMRESSGRIVLGDFGTGQDLTAGLLDAGDLAGTPAYLAPEIFRGAAATPASDIYSLGALLFQLVTGRYPVEGRNLTELRAAHAAGRRVSADALTRKVPSHVARAIVRAIHPDPAGRFQSAREMARALEAPANRARWIAVAAGVVSVVGVAAWLAANMSVVPTPSDVARRDLHLPAPPPTPTTTVAAALAIPAAVPQPQQGSDVVPVAELLPAAFQFRGIAVIRRPALDGRMAACTIQQSLAVCDLVLGTAKPIGPKRPPNAVGVREAAISPDGQLIAYVWDELNTMSLRVSTIDGRDERELFEAPHRHYTLLNWDQAGTGIFVSTLEDGISTYRFVPLEGPPRIVATSQAGGQLSPDAKWIAFWKPGPGGDFEIYVEEIATGLSRIVASHPADDSRPIWTPDGRGLVFSSTRRGERALFIVDFNGGHPSAPRLVTTIGRATVTHLGFTGNHDLFVLVMRKWTDAVIADVDLAAGTISAPRQVHTGSLSTSLGTAWSTDGRKLAYLTGPIGETSDPKSGRVVARELPAGRVEDYPLGGGAVGSRAFWLHDGRLAVSYSEGTERVLDAIDLRTQDRTRLLAGRWQSVFMDQFRPVAYVRQRIPDQLGGDLFVYRHDLGLQSRTLLFDTTRPGPVAAQAGTTDLQVAEDGRMALFVARGRDRSAIRVLGTDGTFRDVDGLPECSSLAWSRDGKFLVAGCFGAQGVWVASLWILNVESGSLTQIPTTTDLIRHLSIRPDGRMIAYAAGNPQPEYLRVRVGKAR